MLTLDVLLFWALVGAIACAAYQFVFRRFFSIDARERRRRRRSYAKAVSRRSGPTVKLASKVPPE